MFLPSSLVSPLPLGRNTQLFKGSVPWLILYCARRTSTFSARAFREQEDNQATPPSPLEFLYSSSLEFFLNHFRHTNSSITLYLYTN